MTIDNNQNINFIHIVQSRFRQTVSQSDRQVPDGNVVHDLSEHGRGDDGVTVTWQQGVMAFVDHFPLQ